VNLDVVKSDEAIGVHGALRNDPGGLFGVVFDGPRGGAVGAAGR
jgi:hypothetical protein